MHHIKKMLILKIVAQIFVLFEKSSYLCVIKLKLYMIMNKMVVLFGCQHKQAARAYLVSARVQYSMSVDICTGDVRVSLPHAKGASFLAELRCNSIPYELI